MLTYERLTTDARTFETLRARVPGGWLVVVDADYGTGAAFVPDPDHEWDGSSAPGGATPLITPPAGDPAADAAQAPPFTPEQQG